MQRERGFSLVEMLLSVGIIAMLVGITAPLYVGFVARNDLDICAQNVASAMRRAQTFARGEAGDSQWGVAIASGQIVLFKGATYAARDTSYDETITIPTTITPTGLSEVSFSKLSATPSTTGTVTLTSSTTKVRTVVINAKGMVDY